MTIRFRAPSASMPRTGRPGVPAVLVGCMLALAPLAWSTSPAAAQWVDADPQGVGAAAPRAVEAARIPADLSVRIDGSLDDQAWRLAAPITEFRQQDPIEGGVPSERTEIRILFDDDALYIGAMLYDSDPGGILAHQLQRDVGLGTDDRFMWILDTFRDGRTGYFFETNPAGLMGDGLIGGGGGLNKRWDGIWDVRTRISDEGWSVEVRIPFSTLNFDPSVDAWGINFQRTIRRKSEEILWSGWRRNESLFRPIHAGQLRGLTGVSQGVGIEVQPYAVLKSDQSPPVDPSWSTQADVGFDVSYSITPSLRAGVTVNTDFAEVEVDQRRVNLTRFPLRFPEQRGFFLEGSGVHSFNWADPFFSRRVGLVQGQEVPIQVGARLGGQAGRYELGFYQIRTGEAPLEFGGARSTWPVEDFTVARVKRSLFNQSHLGVVYTRRATAFDPFEGPDADPLADRHTVGGDIDLYTSQFLGRFNAQIEGFMIYHTDPASEATLFGPERRSRGYRWNFPNDLIRLHSSYRDFGVAWDPAVGFAQRTGFRRHQPTLTIAPRPSFLPWVRQTEHQLYFEYLTDMDGLLLTRNLNFTFLTVNFESGDRLSFSGGRNFERLDAAFTLRGSGGASAVVDAGDYHSWGWSLGGRTAGRRTLSGSADFEWTDFWDGRRTQYDFSATARPRRGVSVSTDYQRNEVRLDQGSLDTNLVRLSGSWNLSPLKSMTGNIQYDDVSQVLGLFARARWIVRPGNDVFVVWGHNWRNAEASLFDRQLSTISRGLAMKVNYTYRF